MKKIYIAPKIIQVGIQGPINPICDSARLNDTPTGSWGNAPDRDFFEFNNFDWIFCE